MHSLTSEYLNGLAFTAEQVGSIRTIGEYRGKQMLFVKQSPDTLAIADINAVVPF